MRYVILVLIVACLSFSPKKSYADYAAEVQLQNVYVGTDMCWIQSTADISNTCSYFGYRFKFNITTHQGKAMLSVVLMAKALNKKISVWYNKSSAVGTNETNGCTPETMAEATGVAVN